jgi:UrcA family protein
MSSTIKSALAALILAAAFAPSALAQSPGEPGSVKVAYGDLDMSTATGGEILLKRVQSAARKACVKVIPRSSLTPQALTFCRRDTVEHAVRGMGIASLTAAWTGQPATNLASR